MKVKKSIIFWNIIASLLVLIGYYICLKNFSIVDTLFFTNIAAFIMLVMIMVPTLDNTEFNHYYFILFPIFWVCIIIALIVKFTKKNIRKFNNWLDNTKEINK